MRFEPGDLVGGRYRLEHPLGEGGMGAVWAAKHTVTGKTVALKLLLDRADDPQLRQRLLREARAVCAVTHPNVVPVHDVLELEGGAPALVMDMLTGESLAAKLERVGKLPHDEVARIAIDVLAALEAAHACGIVHRDLKPDNVFLSRAPGSTTDHVKVLDFGIAKVTTLGEGDAQAAALTRTDAMVGTPYYMAPEQVYGEKDIDARSDLWSMGIVMYECLAGVRPTEGSNLGQIFKLVTVGPFPPVAEKAPGIPPALAELVMRCLERARDARPASARVLRDALERVRAGDTLDGADVAARAVDLPRPPPKKARGWGLLAAGALFVAATLGGAGYASKARTAPTVAALAPPGLGQASPPPSAAPLTSAPTSPPAATPPLTSAPTSPSAATPPAPSVASVASARPLAATPAKAQARPRPGSTTPTVVATAAAATATATAATTAAKDDRAAGKVVVTPPF